MRDQRKESTRYRAGLSVFAVVVLLLLTSLPVMADGNGATHQYYTSCFHPSGGFTICATYDILTNTVVTPSGNVNYLAHNTNSSTISGPDGTMLSSSVTKQEIHSLTKEGINQVLANHVTTNSTYFFNNQTCTSIREYHLANGQVQFDRYEYQCS